MTQVFLLASSTISLQSLPDPGDWNPVNTVEIVATGGQGANGVAGDHGGAGAGGGSYAIGTNINPAAFPVPYYCFKSGNFGSQYHCSFNSPNDFTAKATGPNAVSAQIGGGGLGSSSGTGGLQFYPAGFPGGNGGNTTVTGTDRGGGGGGAGGPHGGGSAGGNASNTGPGGIGGAADAGTVAGGASGTIGNSSTQWDATHGIGSGGGGSPFTAVPGKGGNCGGGGGGGSASPTVAANRTGAVGGDALIILTYTPLKKAAGFNMPMLGM